jgi:hypothetical protein
MGPGLGQQLGLESLPRLARSRRPVPRWSGRPGRLGTLGTLAAVGSAAATSTAVGAWGQRDVEPYCQWLGILEQRGMDSDLTKYRESGLPPQAARRRQHNQRCEAQILQRFCLPVFVQNGLVRTVNATKKAIPITAATNQCCQSFMLLLLVAGSGALTSGHRATAHDALQTR